MCRRAGLQRRRALTGMTYNPFTKVYALARDTDVNYISARPRSRERGAREGRACSIWTALWPIRRADLASAVNTQRTGAGVAPLALSELRPLVSQGARGMLRAGFGLAPDSPGYGALREEFLELVRGNLCRETRCFPAWMRCSRHWSTAGSQWGVVTNKLHASASR